ncbi:helix-turn-helix domain-containing protein [uncultured Litoreibacter sp.]|uniref:helix-turn-helix domain-containing protein n=1 Tax=uncultured Litoreibacter sp. TaxID=1392394 RepID=UPI002611EB4B|nr:helix-turn-helix domain-containing protein [uncultured Litoreibacter sp.]
MKYTLGQAAKETNVSKPTLSRAIKKGELSANGGGGKPYRIDPSELGRWLTGYRERNPEVSVTATPDETSNGNRELEAEVEALREQIEREEIERTRERSQLEAHIDDLRGRVERAERKEDQLMAQLTDQRAAQPEPVEPPKKRGFFAQLLG